MESVLKQRLFSAIIFVLIVLSLAAAGKAGILVLLSLILTGVVFEMLKLNSRSLLITFVYLTLSLLVVVGFYFIKPEQSYLIIGILILSCTIHFFIALKMVLKLGPIFPIVEKTMFIYPVLGIASAVRYIGSYQESANLILGLLLLIWSCDTGAYLVGRKIGKHKLFESVSPNKTWEGFGGSVLFTLLASYPISILFDEYSTGLWTLLALIVVIFGTLGDLVQSKIKREFNVKDSGKLMPGHGGMWDRFDSFVFSLPFAIFLVHFFQ